MVKKILLMFILMLTIFSLKNVQANYEGEYMEEYRTSIKYLPVGDYKIDSKKINYYSQTYEIQRDKTQILSYTIKDISDFPEGTYVANAETGEKQTEFTGTETKFKIMVPVYFAKTDFIGKIKISANFKAINIYHSEGGEIETNYSQDTNEQTIIFDNRTSSLKIEIIGDRGEKVDGVKLDVWDIFQVEIGQLEPDEEGNIKIDKISGGKITIRLLEMPYEYTYIPIEITTVIDSNSNTTYKIELIHKQGNLHLTDNVPNATFQIYDSNINLVGVYNANENGELNIEKLDIGKYLLIQKDVDDKYIRAENQYFEITYEETCNVEVVNQEKTIPDIEENDDILSGNTQNQENAGTSKEDKNTSEESKENNKDTEGKNPVEQEQKDKNTTQPSTTQPSTAESSTTKPNTTKPSTTQPNTTESNTTESNKPEENTTEQNKVDKNEANKDKIEENKNDEKDQQTNDADKNNNIEKEENKAENNTLQKNDKENIQDDKKQEDDIYIDNKDSQDKNQNGNNNLSENDKTKYTQNLPYTGENDLLKKLIIGYIIIVIITNVFIRIKYKK